MKRLVLLVFAVALSLSACKGASEPASPAGAKRLPEADVPGAGWPPELLASRDQWPLPNGDYSSTRSAMGGPITAASVRSLQIAWSVPVPAQAPFGAIASNPIIAGKVVFLQDLESNVHAIDLASGELIWQRLYGVPVIGPNGPAIGYDKIFALAAPNTFVALDQATGDEVWSVELPEPADVQPVVYDGLVYLGTASDGNASHQPGLSGMVYAFDAASGEVRWRFQVVEEGFWGNPEINSGGGIWFPPAIDPQRGLTYWATGNPAPAPGTTEFPNGTSRPGPNLYTNSLLALDHRSGEMSWYHQALPHDLFDRDLQLSPVLARLQVQGKQRDVVIVSGKLGRVFAFDADSHELLWETEVGEHKNDHLQELPLDETVEVLPGIYGAVATPIAYAAGVVYVPLLNISTLHSATAHGAASGKEALVYTSVYTQTPGEGTGGLVALDAGDGKILWQRDFDSPAFGAATVVNDVVFTSTFDGLIRAFHRENGEELWSYQAPGGINGWPAVAGDTIVFPVGLGPEPQLIAFRLAAG